MRIDILTLFPKIINAFIEESIIKRAINNNIVEINVIDYRKFSDNKHNQVDDTPYGGGCGMVLKCEPIYKALQSIKTPESFVILLTPQGKPYKQQTANYLKDKKHLIFICGHYEGFDERIRSFCDMEISIGDYVLTNGELPALIISDSIIRLLDSAINYDSHEYDSFSHWRLEHPQYTKPSEFLGMKVPDVLLSGNHKEIEKWKIKESLRRTYERRKDLICENNLTEEEKKLLEEIKIESN